jgi:hypothetical protein
MKYQNFLYSRSYEKEKDHRWILTPSYFSKQDLEKIKNLFWLEDLRNNLSSGQKPFSFGVFFLSNSYVVARFRQTDFVDEFRRPIDCIDGIAVPLSNSWLLRIAISSILGNEIEILDSWATINFKESGLLTNAIEDIISEEKSPNLFERVYAFNKNPFDFSERGFFELINFLRPTTENKSMSLLQIGYGIIDLSKYSSFDLITPFIMKYTLPKHQVHDSIFGKSNLQTKDAEIVITNSQNKTDNDLENPSFTDMKENVMPGIRSQIINTYMADSNTNAPQKKIFSIEFVYANGMPLNRKIVNIKLIDRSSIVILTDKNGIIFFDHGVVVEVVTVNNKTYRGPWIIDGYEPIKIIVN